MVNISSHNEISRHHFSDINNNNIIGLVLDLITKKYEINILLY